MIQVDKLVCARDVKNNVELIDGFLLRHPECRFGGWKTFGVEWILCPLTRRGEIFKGVVVFNEDVHKIKVASDRIIKGARAW